MSQEAEKKEKILSSTDVLRELDEQYYQTASPQKFQRRIWEAYLSQEYKIEEFKKQVTNYSEEMNTVKDQIAETKDELSHIQTKSIETIGIFVALFTFISVNLQFLKNASDLSSAAFFSMIIAAITGMMILVFLLVISPYNENKEWKEKFKRLIFLFISLLVLGFIGLYFPEIKINQESNNINASVEVPIN